MKARFIRIAAASVLAIAVSAGIAWWQVRNAETTVESGVKTAVPIGGPFTLTDNHGRTVTDADFRGKYMLIYFGYTYCPDVCPTELGVMTQVVDQLGPKAERIQPVFITVDPDRDTVAHINDYVGLFHPRLVGLTGTEEQVREAARAYRVYYAKAPMKDGKPEDYLMDHSSFIYLMGPDGKFVGVYPGGTAADKIVQDLSGRIDG
ncbi:SCO family protein [Azospirillum ramasamyi]|uniref:SCO family protein n=1 Tax=Azospirillum ramasamyi TaxID=682998 RepID=A0A2U9S1Q8_9PROT|nr:SCO family protein [Azospirillum ramasamyi]AWU93212.1 SCO family protein [Azospirillum ramasamyi]